MLILLANFPLGGGLAVIGVMMSDRQSSSVGIAVGNQDMVVADRVMLDTEDTVGTTNDLRLVIRKCSGHASGMTRESHASHSPQTNAQHAIDELRL